LAGKSKPSKAAAPAPQIGVEDLVVTELLKTDKDRVREIGKKLRRLRAAAGLPELAFEWRPPEPLKDGARGVRYNTKSLEKAWRKRASETESARKELARLGKETYDTIDAPTADTISTSNARENDEKNLPTAHKPNERDLLTDLFNAYNVPKAERDALVSIIQREIGRVLTAKAKLVLPSEAPKLYADRPTGQSMIDFLRDKDGWGPYVAAGLLTRLDFRRLDPAGEMALRNWLRSNDLPDDVRIPTKKEVNDTLLSADAVPAADVRRLGRLVDTRRRRGVPSPV
jgi:hypothetical protein